jgi:hypothetical protein
MDHQQVHTDLLGVSGAQDVNIDEWFDYPGYCRGDQMDVDPQSSSGYESIPALTHTSSTSRSDAGDLFSSSPPPSPPRMRKQLDEYKQHDDHLTIPQAGERNVKASTYLPLMQMQHSFAADPRSAPDSQRGSPDVTTRITSVSPPRGPLTPDSASSSKSPLGRGKRTKPLNNKEDVAEVRAMGACYRCKITKVAVGTPSAATTPPNLTCGSRSTV